MKCFLASLNLSHLISKIGLLITYLYGLLKRLNVAIHKKNAYNIQQVSVICIIASSVGP